VISRDLFIDKFLKLLRKTACESFILERGRRTSGLEAPRKLNKVNDFAEMR
jgi:hypothetical protein